MPRHKEYDPRRALDAALSVFWERGYRGTSIRDLERAMGVNRFGIQTFFKGKRQLFLTCLDRYTELTFETLLGDSPGGLQTVEELFRTLVDPARMPPQAMHGCFVVNTIAELTSDSPEAAHKRARTHVARVEQALLRSLEQAREAGELREDLNLDDCAKYLSASTFAVHIANRAAGRIGSGAPVVRMILSQIQAWRPSRAAARQ